MATVDDLGTLKDKLVEKQMPEKEVNKIIAYLKGAIEQEAADKRRKAGEGKTAKTPVTDNAVDQLYTLIFKFWNMGLLVDGVNVIVAGRNMAMVTFHGYKNKVLSTYPETQFDIQLVHQGDEFRVAKESGSVVYSHGIADPFQTENAPIIGAYVVFKNKRGEFLETLNKSDFEKMKKASKQPYLWGEWESEFWLKSVIKRACKRHFFDVVEEIDKYDNDNFGLRESDRPIDSPDTADKVAAAVTALQNAESLVVLTNTFRASGVMHKKEVVAAFQQRKTELTAEVPQNG